METKIKSLENLREIASKSFHVVEPCKSRPGKGTAKISIDNYAELSYFLLDTIKVSIAALDAEHESVTSVRNVSSAVSGVLGKLLDIIPMEEMDLLDKVRAFIAEDDGSEIQK